MCGCKTGKEAELAILKNKLSRFSRKDWDEMRARHISYGIKAKDLFPEKQERMRFYISELGYHSIAAA